jgi:hypothetical protein
MKKKCKKCKTYLEEYAYESYDDEKCVFCKYPDKIVLKKDNVGVEKK